MPAALRRVCRTWLVSAPIMATQLALIAAMHPGDAYAAHHLPLAASGAGEPFVSAAGILGVMAIWRTFYAGFMDWSFFVAFDSARSARPQEHTDAWWAAARGMAAVCGGGAIVVAGMHAVAQGVR